MEADFSGYATRNDIECSDGRTIRAGAFKHSDGLTVPLVWQHQHNDSANVLGRAVLEHREDGVYAYGFFNETENGKNAKLMVKHGDIKALSIYANNLTQKGKDVMHGNIREVSLVLSGANPGAFIENVSIKHGDTVSTSDDEAVIYSGLTLEHGEEHEESESSNEELDVQEVLESMTEAQQAVVHGLITEALAHGQKKEDGLLPNLLESMSDEQKTAVQGLIDAALTHANTNSGGTVATATADKTVQDVFDTLTDDQKNVVYFMIGQALEEAANGGSAQHSENSEEFLAHIDSRIKEGFEEMSRNVFEQNSGTKPEGATLSHAQIAEIVADAQKTGSFKESFLAHVQNYGITDIDLLFPDAQNVTSSPEFLSRRMEWVQAVLGDSKHSPFSRIKSTVADITAEDARAKGYVKGNLKKDEIIRLLRRITTPTTVYKKQKLDRDDIVDITDLDVVTWLKGEMRIMLDEELARAILIGDGRQPDDPDKINEDHIRPVAWDDEMYSHSVTVPSNIAPDAIVESILRARTFYKGTGTPALYTTDSILTDLILLKDKVGRRLYANEAELAAALRVSKIVVVEPMETVPELLAIVVNIADYTVGADKGGQLGMFDDFDIDYNQHKYLLESRVSGALTKPKSAVVVKKTLGTLVTPDVPTYNAATHVITIPAKTGVEYWDVTDILTATKITTATVTITKTTDIEARPAAGYTFPHNIDADWTFAYTA